MKALPNKVRRIVSSPIFLTTTVLAGLIFWYFLYGPCGYVRVQSSIGDMNEIFHDWQALRDVSIPEISKNGEVGFEIIATMEEWRALAYQLRVPGCLEGARSSLIDAIESDYQTFHLARDRISIDQKMQYLSSNTANFVKYEQQVDLIEACAPVCSLDADFPDLLEVFTR